MKIKIGLVDDHQLFLDGLVSLLSQDDDFQIAFAVIHAKSALDFLEKNEIDILITDVSMPEISGVEFIKILKDYYPDLKILVLSMYEGIVSFKQINGYIKKESLADELIVAIKEIINGNNYFQVTAESKFDIEFNKKIVTNREKEVIELIASGFSTEEIAAKLYLSKGTIETHKKNIYIKLKVKTAPELVRMAMHLGIIS